ncbi:magnesium chelatase subunit H [Telmatospirillum siberiense]|uniref:magnesium chelatase n=2 Tax=Telmatospirillum siberiense TaxID=382514 RepID=A0A2N3PTB4_9PROT|nr:magnesium chelatase subunit H [Telmatospirillum siberiense]
MTQNPILPAEAPPMRVVIVTLDRHLARVAAQVSDILSGEYPGLSLRLHATAEWENNPLALESCRADIATGDIIFVTMLFMEDHIRAILPALEARREQCDAMIVTMSAAETVKLTKMGAFRADAPQTGTLALLKKLRGSAKNGAKLPSSGAAQMAMLRRLPKILRMIPGKAQDVRAYFLCMQYWLAGSEANLDNMVRFLVNRYADGARRGLRGTIEAALPVDYPEVGLYHPEITGGVSDRLEALPATVPGSAGTVGVLVLRSYVLAGDKGHYDGVIRALESKGLRTVPAFASGLDARPAIEKFFTSQGRPAVDAILSLTGFSLVGGPAYNHAEAAQEILTRMDVPYIAAQPVEFQTIEAWNASTSGLTPVEATIMVSLPELDGAIAPTVFGGRSESAVGGHQMQTCDERADMLAARVARLVALRRTARRNRKLAIVLFNFPPNAGATGSAAYLSVFESLHHILTALKDGGYDVEVPDDVTALRQRLLNGNAGLFGTDANVHMTIPVDDHVRREPHLAAIERQWGAAPGRQLSDGYSLFVQGERFGNVFVGIQPGFGYEGDPMRLLFEGGFAPTHAFTAFYRYIREDFAAHAVLHFGTHGALEFMPGKHVGLSQSCWPDRLIQDLPNFYLYAANNPSEGALAKRRAAATLISYLTPPIARAGLYKGLLDLKATIEHWRASPGTSPEDRAEQAALIREQAALLDLGDEIEDTAADNDAWISNLSARLYDYEQTLIPEGLHVIGEPPSPEARADLLLAMADAHHGLRPHRRAIEALIAGMPPKRAAALSGLTDSSAGMALFCELAVINGHLSKDSEILAVLRALDGRFVPPVTGGDLLRTPAILPTGRNLHGFDPFGLPSASAQRNGVQQAQYLLDRHRKEGAPLPETVAFVLWGTDNLKSEGEPIAQVLALMGAKARFDSYGRLCGAELIPLQDLERPRIDVIATLSGIFRDLLPLQTKMLADAAFLAASADEPLEMNFIRKHALAYQAELGCDLETAALRVFSNADGAYGANVNQMIDAGCWVDGDELADAYESRKCFAYGRAGKASKQPALLGCALKTADLAYQNLDSLELGITTIDHYVDTLGGISRAVRRAKGVDVAVYVGDRTQGEGKVRTLAEQVTLETRTRTLNPRWYDGLLRHGYEGVRQIEAQVTNTMGWSATTSQVAPWVYQRISETFVLDEAMRNRLVDLNPKASARMANRLIEAYERKYWTPDSATLQALRDAGDDIEDRLEGVMMAME